jgi:hypothetical protein
VASTATKAAMPAETAMATEAVTCKTVCAKPVMPHKTVVPEAVTVEEPVIPHETEPVEMAVEEPVPATTPSQKPHLS